ncbi:hypothetical protein KKA95_03350, partial [Patescibacteria group bacterium]|nr:hypothetical protein [Patescibacteria group bacterium]
DFHNIMFKNFIKLSALVIMLLLLPIVSIQASGKIEAKLGSKVTLQAEETNVGSNYKWVIKKGSEIITTQATSILSYTFVEQGEYNVNLVETDPKNNIKTTSVMVLVGDRYPRPTEEGETVTDTKKPGPLVVELTTLPKMQEDGSVQLLGDGKVLFDIEVTRTDVLEYRIDKNIFADSDGNGTANDDVDNASDDSYLLGGIWQTEYSTEESSKIVAEITLVTSGGEKAKQQVEMVFADNVRKEGNPVAILDVLPYPSNEDQLVYLYDNEEEVGFYSRRSEGDITEYRIDRNIFVDSDGDGNPENDIDNVNDISFKTGDVWKTTYKKTDQQIIAQLIVVGAGGTGSRVQRGLWFTDKPKPTIEVISAEEDIRLSADKTFVLKGDAITFAVEGLPGAITEYTYTWDFDGDGEADKETEAENTITHIYEIADIYDAKVTITDLEGNFVDRTLEVLVKDVIATVSDFTFEIDGNKVMFTNTSTVALNLADKSLDYKWNFADTEAENYEDQQDQITEKDPEYTYTKAGTYIVSLTITDSDDVIDTKTAEIIIENDFVPTEITGDGEIIGEAGVEKEGGSLIVKILKVLLYLILIIIILLILIFGGFLVFLKVQHPDLTLEELVDEVKIKILGLMGIHDMLEEPTPINEPVDEQIDEPVEEEAEKSDEEAPAEEPELAKETGPVPDWMKGVSDKPAPSAPEKEVIEGELEEETPAPAEEPIPKAIPTEPAPETPKEGSKPPKGDAPLDKPDGPVPDWLKK